MGGRAGLTPASTSAAASPRGRAAVAGRTTSCSRTSPGRSARRAGRDGEDGTHGAGRPDRLPDQDAGWRTGGCATTEDRLQTATSLLLGAKRHDSPARRSRNRARAHSRNPAKLRAPGGWPSHPAHDRPSRRSREGLRWGLPGPTTSCAHVVADHRAGRRTAERGGTPSWAWIGSANRDESVFNRPLPVSMSARSPPPACCLRLRAALLHRCPAGQGWPLQAVPWKIEFVSAVTAARGWAGPVMIRLHSNFAAGPSTAVPDHRAA